MRTSDFDYELPPQLIAQDPLPERSASRMLVVRRADAALEHRAVTDLPDFLRAGDLLVLNDTRVFPARLRGVREDTGGKVEILLLAPPAERGGTGGADAQALPALLRSGSRARAGMRLLLGNEHVQAEVALVHGGGRVDLNLRADAPLVDLLEAVGDVPLPPYIRRDTSDNAQAARDRRRYQTVYAAHTGAVAAPTAGFHLTEALLDDLRERGVEQARVTLHVGPGTFRPVTAERAEDHPMHAEWYRVPESTAEAVRATRARGGRVVAVGTTSVRSLETVAAESGEVQAGEGWTQLFIRPPYVFRAVDVLLTNFHLPRSTLLMLVSAFCGAGRPAAAGRRLALRAYRKAVRQRYRFYSYGDCMLIV